VSAKIEEQVKAGSFPVRLKAHEWRSGDLVWLLDLISPSARQASAAVMSFRSIAKTNEVRIHPAVAGMLDPDLIKALTKGAETGKPNVS
jgi:hemolysin-activating ACP:hemolysin acyltransferase